MPKNSITEKLQASRVLIFNSKDAEVATLLDAIGIDTAYIDAGEALYTETMQLQEDRKEEQQEQSLAFDKFYLAKDEAEKIFRRRYKLVTVLSRNDANLQNRLGLDRRMPDQIEKWINQAIDLYNAILNESDFLTTLGRFKVTTEILEEERDQIEELRELRNDAVAEKGQAQEATRLRNEKLDELEDYARELRAIAKIALEGRPQLLEKLGILVRS